MRIYFKVQAKFPLTNRESLFYKLKYEFAPKIEQIVCVHQIRRHFEGASTCFDY